MFNTSFFFKAAAFLGFSAVALGAFGAHGLEGKMPAASLEIFETAARYQIIHALALLAVSLALSVLAAKRLAAAGGCFLAGTVLFSGSLYLLVLTGVKTWGALTPVGGLFLMGGWALLFLTPFDLRGKQPL